MGPISRCRGIRAYLMVGLRIQEPVELRLHNRITLANPRFQLRSIQHGDGAAAIADYSTALQLAGRFGHALAPHAEHVGNELLSHAELARVQPIEAEKQPAA